MTSSTTAISDQVFCLRMTDTQSVLAPRHGCHMSTTCDIIVYVYLESHLWLYARIQRFSVKYSFFLSNLLFFFFFNDTATTEIYTLSLHDALPFCSKEHTSQLHSHSDLVCRLLL